MNPTYEQALNGTLCQPSDAYSADFTITIYNNLAVPICMFGVSETGGLYPCSDPIAPGMILTIAPRTLLVLGYYVFKAASTGAFAAVIQLRPDGEVDFNEYYIAPDLLVLPNDIGPYNTPTATIPVPLNSPRVLVGSGSSLTPTGNRVLVTHEQYWQRLGDSYVVLPGSDRTVSTTVVTGSQTTTSEQEVFAAGLGLSASSNWGVISASVSASLNYQSTSFQQVTVTQQTTQFESQRLTNDTATPQMYLRWQLTDIVAVFDAAGVPQGAVQSGQAPILIDGPYDPKALPPPPVPSPGRASLPSSRWPRPPMARPRRRAAAAVRSGPRAP